MNKKYFLDIQNFPKQFESMNFVLNSTDLKIKKRLNKIILFGMGGSSLYVDLFNDYMNFVYDFNVDVVRDYFIFENKIKKYRNALFIFASYSGNTEETISCLNNVLSYSNSSLINHDQILVLSSGGELENIAKNNNLNYVQIPAGIQPRMATGYFLTTLFYIVEKFFTYSVFKDLKYAFQRIRVDTEKAKNVALNLKNYVPILYTSNYFSSIARILKIKLNENSKVPAFWNTFPELNHNEMVGFTNKIFNPFFILIRSNFDYHRNILRLQNFRNLMVQKSYPTLVLHMEGENVLEQMLNTIHFFDYVSFFLAENYGIDPEKVDMVEEFKNLLK